jgi:hypothetical protein
MNVHKPNTQAIPKVFLAGSIELGKAEEWQTIVERALQIYNVDVYNPRGVGINYEDMKQELNDPDFFKQVKWEQDHLDAADLIIMYFDKNTKSVISLLELGQYSASGKMAVCCPEGFYRKGNVDYVCKKNNIPMFDTLEDLIQHIESFILKF